MNPILLSKSGVSARKGYTRCRSRGRLWAGGSWGVDEAHGVGAGNGVKEGKWSSSCRPNVFFAEPLLFAFHTARLAARHSRCGNCRLWIHEARETAGGLVINPAAFTHTSVAILDALNTCEFPIIEVHISNVHKREVFRHHSYVSLAASGVIAGLGTQGYTLAIQRLARLIDEKKK